MDNINKKIALIAIAAALITSLLIYLYHKQCRQNKDSLCSNTEYSGKGGYNRKNDYTG